MTIDWSATAAWIALCVTVITPLLTTITRNRHEIKMYKLQYREKRRDEVVSGYLRSLSAIVMGRDYNNLAEYGRYYGEIFIYAPSALWDKIVDMNGHVSALFKPTGTDMDVVTARTALTEILESFADPTGRPSSKRM